MCILYLEGGAFLGRLSSTEWGGGETTAAGAVLDASLPLQSSSFSNPLEMYTVYLENQALCYYLSSVLWRCQIAWIFRKVCRRCFEYEVNVFGSLTIVGKYCEWVSKAMYTRHVINTPSNRQHLSYDVCLEVRGEIIRTVLCCIVYWSCTQS